MWVEAIRLVKVGIIWSYTFVSKLSTIRHNIMKRDYLMCTEGELEKD